MISQLSKILDFINKLESTWRPRMQLSPEKFKLVADGFTLNCLDSFSSSGRGTHCDVNNSFDKNLKKAKYLYSTGNRSFNVEAEVIFTFDSEWRDIIETNTNYSAG